MLSCQPAPPPSAAPAALDAPGRATICIRPDASIECLYSDALALHEVGRLTVERASHVGFDRSRGEWVARDAVTGVELCASVERSACLSFEEQHYNRALRDGYRPPFSSREEEGTE